MADSQMAATYPTEEQYERWKQEAEEFDMSTSEFMQAMIEAGLKKFERHVETDEEASELRRQRNDFRDELERSRERVKELENQLYDDERAEVKRIIEKNPGVEFEQIVQRVYDTVPGRVNRHLTELEGEKIRTEGEEFYPLGETV